ncbi:hypothetical protein [Amnibacterium endophyticum]|uniref:Uncharacterized protein n=1 Tax=Amnibacterium endophyticum TaxID=2109337 RepID=A0ABW4LG61_9MICO
MAMIRSNSLMLRVVLPGVVGVDTALATAGRPDRIGASAIGAGVDTSADVGAEPAVEAGAAVPAGEPAARSASVDDEGSLLVGCVVTPAGASPEDAGAVAEAPVVLTKVSSTGADDAVGVLLGVLDAGVLEVGVLEVGVLDAGVVEAGAVAPPVDVVGAVVDPVVDEPVPEPVVPDPVVDPLVEPPLPDVELVPPVEPLPDDDPEPAGGVVRPEPKMGNSSATEALLEAGARARVTRVLGAPWASRC